MGFSIGGFIGALAPVVGSAFGPIGTAIGGAIGAGFARPPPAPAPLPARVVRPQTTFASASPLSSLVPQPFSRFVPPKFDARVRAPTVMRRAAQAGEIMSNVMGFFGGQESISEILNEARQTFGRGVTKNKIIDAAKVCGIAQAADTFGLSESQVCRVIVAGRTRRRRGISAADIRRTRRTLRTVKSIRSDLKAIRL